MQPCRAAARSAHARQRPACTPVCTCTPNNKEEGLATQQAASKPARRRAQKGAGNASSSPLLLRPRGVLLRLRLQDVAVARVRDPQHAHAVEAPARGAQVVVICRRRRRRARRSDAPQPAPAADRNERGDATFTLGGAPRGSPAAAAAAPPLASDPRLRHSRTPALPASGSPAGQQHTRAGATPCRSSAWVGPPRGARGGAGRALPL